MRIGLVTDVHNHSAELSRALELFRGHGVDQVVTIGDTCDPFCGVEGADEVALLLNESNAVGVWGNHDFNLCYEVEPKVRERYSPFVLEVMARMKPRLIMEDCHFSHKEASVDPYDVAQLWDFVDPPLELMERASLAFAAVENRLQFIGHYHRWWAANPTGPMEWSGNGILRFEPEKRYFVIVGAVFEGCCGILDTEQDWLEPHRFNVTTSA